MTKFLDFGEKSEGGVVDNGETVTHRLAKETASALMAALREAGVE